VGENTRLLACTVSPSDSDRDRKGRSKQWRTKKNKKQEKKRKEVGKEENWCRYADRGLGERGERRKGECGGKGRRFWYKLAKSRTCQDV